MISCRTQLAPLLGQLRLLQSPRIFPLAKISVGYTRSADIAQYPVHGFQLHDKLLCLPKVLLLLGCGSDAWTSGNSSLGPSRQEKLFKNAHLDTPRGQTQSPSYPSLRNANAVGSSMVCGHTCAHAPFRFSLYLCWSQRYDTTTRVLQTPFHTTIYI